MTMATEIHTQISRSKRVFSIYSGLQLPESALLIRSPAGQCKNNNHIESGTFKNGTVASKRNIE
jgi:hypothetical protein